MPRSAEAARILGLVPMEHSPCSPRRPATRLAALGLLTGALLCALAAAAQPGQAAPASAAGPVSAAAAARIDTPDVVLINQPARSVCVGRTFRVGVWYQQYSGGSAAYRISVSGPRRVRFFYRHGVASSAHWRFWNIRAGRAGRYRIVYSGHRPGAVKWSRYVTYTHARRC
jgi:hypothetical protein